MDEGMKQLLREQQAKAIEKIRSGLDIGHNSLIADIEVLRCEALDLEFHDYLNKKFVAPKVALVDILEHIIKEAKNGRYDN